MPYKRLLIGAGLILSFGAFVLVASANHSWGSYHWARQSNPFTLKVVDSVTSVWDSYLDTANVDWSVSSVLDLTKENGSIDSSDRRRCKPVAGKIRACNSTYGNNGWLGVAQIWISGSHITKATTKVNDTYFNTAYYNTPAWRRLVMCQEIAHDFGLGHQDEIFGNANLGSCMDYTNNPSGPPSNEHPNAHDYDQLELIYAHLDDITTVGQTIMRHADHDDADDVAGWGKSLQKDGNGKTSLYVRDLGRDEKVFTFVIWTE
ncbi:MAG: hypothetical protein G01um101429_663 [Parcubacteria group bacterium Gr01-1014_29]|nr:MAG: hypothetical protein G01um101429_663 [Parcubacteria group bacterium Gr01-1014_29]